MTINTAVREQDENLQKWFYSADHPLFRDPLADPVAVAVEQHWICEYCGEPIPPRNFQADPFGREGRGFWVRPTHHGCPSERMALEEMELKRREMENAKRAKQWADLLEHAGLIGELSSCTFESFKPRRDWPNSARIKEQCTEYAAGLLAGEIQPGRNWLLLVGEYGTGKSHLAAAILREALRCGRRGYFRVWPEYLQRIQASWHDDGIREADILAEVSRGWLVVIDDLDKKRATDWSRESLFSLLNGRYNAQLPTIITLNTRLDEPDPAAPGRLALQAIMGEAILDRVIQSTWAQLDFDGSSYRSGERWQ